MLTGRVSACPSDSLPAACCLDCCGVLCPAFLPFFVLLDFFALARLSSSASSSSSSGSVLHRQRCPALLVGIRSPLAREAAIGGARPCSLVMPARGAHTTGPAEADHAHSTDRQTVLVWDRDPHTHRLYFKPAPPLGPTLLGLTGITPSHHGCGKVLRLAYYAKKSCCY